MSTPCIYCGHPADTIDHIIPRSRGGTDKPSNLAPACKSCNSAKGDRPVEQFLREHPIILARVQAHQAGEDAVTGLEPGEKPRTKDGRIATTVVLPHAAWRALKEVAAAERVPVNDLLLEGAEHVLALNGRRMQLLQEA